MSWRAIKKIRPGVLWLISLLLLVLLIVSIGGWANPGTVTALETTVVCTYGPEFDLETGDGYITTPDGNSLYFWGYNFAGGTFQAPGPTLCVNQGETVTVNLTNNLQEPVSIVFRGQAGVTTTGGIAGLFTAEAAAAGGTVSYSFVASQPGTYLYESGTAPHKQVQMGLFGALIVRPSESECGFGPDYAYCDAATQFNPEREYLLLMHDIDPLLHLAVERGEPYDVTQIWDRYWTINGRAFPDTIAPNNAAWLPGQPYGALVHIEPYDSVTNPLPALVRYANAGMENHPFHPHGNNLVIIGRDGRYLGDANIESFTTTVGSGQSYDLFAQWFDVEAWDPDFNPIPVSPDQPFPGLYNYVIADDATFFSGSPYLGADRPLANLPTGQDGDLGPQVTSFNECGEFYFPWHSHALNEFQNFDEGFGGLATLWRVDPPGGCP